MKPGPCYVCAALLTVGCGGDGGTGVVPEPNLNRPPVLLQQPDTVTFHNEVWRYTPNWSDPDGDATTFEVLQLPAWMAFDADAVMLEGIPGYENVGSHSLRLRLNDGSVNVFESFTILVQKGEIDCDEGWPGSPAQAEYVLPFEAGRTFNVSQSYCNPTNSHNLLHAYDIDTEIGDTLVASRSGIVLFVRDQFADNNATSGQENWVWIQHEDGSVMNYVHITTDGALVSVGDEVQQGQPIAISGNSGLTHRPHVHTALYRDATDFRRQASIPIAYRNAEGLLDSNGGLRVGQSHTALVDGG